MASAKRGRLVYKLLIILLFASLGPLSVGGYYMLSQSRDVLLKYALADQEALAIGFSNTIYNYLRSFLYSVRDTALLNELQGGDPIQQKAILDRNVNVNSLFVDMFVVNSAGQETAYASRFPREDKNRSFADDPVFRLTMERGEYIGEPFYLKGRPVVMMATRIVSPDTGRVSGMLAVRLSLIGLKTLLKNGFPESSGSEAGVVSPEGLLVASSQDQTGLQVPRPSREVQNALLSSSDKSGHSVIKLKNGESALLAFSELRMLRWIFYIQKPMSVINGAADELLASTTKALAIVLVFALFLGYAMNSVILSPIQQLREAVIKVGEGDFDGLPDLVMPNDEIGELAHSFAEMNDSLRIKTAEVISAKEELEALNRSLESRVEARTRELRVALDELIKKERLAAVGQMASVVGHEIRNPLAVINNSVYFIKTKLGNAGVDDPKISKHIGIIETEIQQANGIINEILGFTRTRELMLKPNRVNAELEDVLGTYPFPPHITVRKQFAPQDPWVHTDLDEMRQALRNVIGNAVEVMPNQGTLQVRTSVENGKTVRIDIADSGPGIPKDVIENIFAPFFTTKARGTGLGLAVVKKVVDRHKGRIEVFSEQGKGTMFSIYLHMAPPPENA